MKEHVCHYALLRFLPYREAGEFVNIGVVLACPELGFLDFAIERKKFKRITDFFPELKANVAIYRDGLRTLDREFERLRLHNGQKRGFSPLANQSPIREAFTALLHPREALFHFGAPRTLLAMDPAQQLRELFENYIERQLTRVSNGPEEHLRRRMQSCLQQFNLSRYYKEDELGNANYTVKFPFVAFDPAFPQNPLKVIKPLNLAQDKSGEVYQHGDDWLARVRRLNKMDALPQNLLFAVNQPLRGTPQQRAAAEICQELATFKGVKTFDFEATTQIINWAQLSFSQTLLK